MTQLGFIEITRRFDNSPEEVFAAWTDPAIAGQWLMTSPNSEAHHHETDLRVGGKWTIRDRRDGTDYVAIGEFLELDPPRKLVFTFGMPQFDPGFNTVTVLIEPDGDGAIMTLIQEGIPLETREPLRHGWTLMFNGLMVALPPRHKVVVTRDLDATPDEVYIAFTDLETMRRWMGQAVEAQVEPGGRYAIRTDTGDDRYTMMVGTYLALVPGKRIIFTFSAGPSDDPETGSPYVDQHVIIDLEPLQGDRTRLTLTHGWGGEGHDEEGMRETAKGWNWWIDRLEGSL
ncbi:uncharacterized protein YndB with AHSA1/START domain [Caulobacter ginsengisoli]|uniref:Uncharacterized protein YndB with AHSA1/START domain n=1 Tax=Caulobacter ginsengisoli TaxID=400775 RepID=A0ABU0IWJ2_9CAUL|nr:SRPBCC family protein [Caulobacter ginsengisoli]MDQ0466391.1 uncharacterized protein YndB with AHSA1/START domain [Caulobacter ginsengisoli]